MTRLEERLRKVRGIADLTVELGDEGLTGIRVRIDPDSDESEVLEEIRRILVAYGLRTRRSSVRVGPVPELLPDEELEAGSLPTVTVVPDRTGLRVTLRDGHRAEEATADPSPLGAAEAMTKVVARWMGVPLPERIAIRRLTMDGDRVVVLTYHRSGDISAGAAVVTTTMTDALYRGVYAGLRALGQSG